MAAAVALMLSGAAPSASATVEESIKAILAVENEGRGNRAASAAWAELSKGTAGDLVKILEAMEGSGPLSANWLRGAIGTIADRELASGNALPVAALGEFLLDTNQHPGARKLAFDLIAQVDRPTVDKLVPGMLMDPSPELRIEAVALLINEGRALAETDANDAAAIVYRQALQGARDVKQVETITKALGDLGREVDLPRHFGFLMNWKVIGPFDNTDRGGFAKVFPPEEEVDYSKTYKGKTGDEVKWIDFVTADSFGKVDINKAFGMEKEATAYAATEFEAEFARPAELRLGTKNGWKIWLNGELIFARDEYHRGARMDMYKLPINLKEGKNRLLVKLCQNEQKETWTVQWEYQLRVCDATGTALLSTNRQPTPTVGTDLQKPAGRRGGRDAGKN